MRKKCFFLGHRDSPGSIKPFLLNAIEKHVREYGVTEFYVGSHGAFDAMAASALSETKEKYPHIHNYLLLAYHPSIQSVKLPSGFDGTLFPEGQELVPPRYAISTLNRRMIKESDYLVANVWMITSGSYKLLRYATGRAKRGQLIIINLSESYRNAKHE